MSEIRATTISDETGNGPIALTKQHAAKAWMNYKGTSTNAISGSFNISGVVDNGTGNYTASFINSMANTVYAPTAKAAGAKIQGMDQLATGSIRLLNYTDAGTLEDNGTYFFDMNGDLA